MKKLLDVAHGKLIDIIGRHGNLDQYSWMSVILSKTIAIVRDCTSPKDLYGLKLGLASLIARSFL